MCMILLRMKMKDKWYVCKLCMDSERDINFSYREKMFFWTKKKNSTNNKFQLIYNNLIIFY